MGLGWSNGPGVDFIKTKNWAQSRFTLCSELVRSFLRRKSLALSVRAWRRAFMKFTLGPNGEIYQQATLTDIDSPLTLLGIGLIKFLKE